MGMCYACTSSNPSLSWAYEAAYSHLYYIYYIYPGFLYLYAPSGRRHHSYLVGKFTAIQQVHHVAAVWLVGAHDTSVANWRVPVFVLHPYAAVMVQHSGLVLEFFKDARHNKLHIGVWQARSLHQRSCGTLGGITPSPATPVPSTQR